MEINNNPPFIPMDEVLSINKEKAALLYNIVFGYTEYNKPAVTFDYEYLYTLIHPFIITKELFESKSNPPQGYSISLNKPSNGKVNYEPIKIIFSENEEGITTTPPTHHHPTHPHPPTTFPTPIPSTPSSLQELPRNNERSSIGIHTPHIIKEANILTIPVLPPKKNVLKNNTKYIQEYIQEPIPNKSAEETRPTFTLVNNQPDPLFWSVYIGINGIKEYEYLNTKYTNHIIDEKQKIVDYIKTNDAIVKPFIKKYKISGVSLKEILSEILSNEPMNFKTLPLYCLYYKINIAFVFFHKNVYYHFKIENAEYETIYIDVSLKTQGSSSAISSIKKYRYLIITDENKITQIKGFYQIDNINKPLLTVSNYKVDDLKEIIQKLKINIENKQGNGENSGEEKGNSKLKKGDIYAIIVEYFKEIGLE
jgi:hypothetical protein